MAAEIRHYFHRRLFVLPDTVSYASFLLINMLNFHTKTVNSMHTLQFPRPIFTALIWFRRTDKVGSHYERLIQRWPAFKKSNKWAQTSAKLRSREGYFHSHYERFISGAIQLLLTFPSVWLCMTAFASAWQRLPALYLFSISVGELLPTQM